MTIDDIRKLPAGSYWVDPDGTLLKLEDVPTGGPLFEVIGEEDEYFKEVQMETNKFTEEKFTRINAWHDSDDREINITFESGDTEHRYRFAMLDDGLAYPKYFEQGGETYRIGLEEIPKFVRLLVEEVYDREVEER